MRIAGASPKRVRILGQEEREGEGVAYRIRRPEQPTQEGWKLTAATRYLCAAAHLQPKFRRRIIQQFAEEPYRAMAPSFGIDPTTVLKHCFAARRQENMRDLFLVSAWIIGGIISAITFPPGGFFVFLALTCLIIVIDRWKTQSLVRSNLLKSNFDPDCVPEPESPQFHRAAAELKQAQESNVLVSSGFSPFAGAGHDVSGWSFALDIDKGKEEFGKIVQPQSFSVSELNDAIARNIQALKIDGLTIEDKLCVNGQDIRDNRKILPDPIRRPVTMLTQDVLQSIIRDPAPHMRHYQHIRVVNWEGELVVSAFLRVCKPGHNLFIEVNYCLVPPLSETYHAIDSLNPFLNWSEWLNLILLSGITAAFMAIFLPFIVLQHTISPFHRWQERSKAKRAVRENAAFNYGSLGSLRELASVSVYRRYFQKLDKEMNMKILERQIFDTIIDFLDAKGIDTSDLKERQTTLLNNGLVVSGSGTIQAESLAVGAGSQALASKVRQGSIRLLERTIGKSASPGQGQV